VKKIILMALTLVLAVAFHSVPVFIGADFAYAKKGKDKGEDVEGRTEDDRSGRGGNNDERRLREDGGGRDDDGRGRGRGRSGSDGGDNVNVVETALELDNGHHGSGDSDALDAADGSQEPAKKIDRYLKRDNYERF